MFIVFFLLFLASLIMIPVALINPKFATKGKYESRKKAFYAYGVAMIASFVLAVATTPPTNTTQVAGEKIEANQPQIKNEQKVQEAFIQPFTETKTPEPVVTPTPSASPTVKATATPKPTSTPTAKPTVIPTSTPKPEPTKAPEVKSNGGACKYSCSGPDRDCGDFSSHSEAQSFFNCCGFSATNDPMRLDTSRGVGNGLACEGLN